MRPGRRQRQNPELSASFARPETGSASKEETYVSTINSEGSCRTGRFDGARGELGARQRQGRPHFADDRPASLDRKTDQRSCASLSAGARYLGRGQEGGGDHQG